MATEGVEGLKGVGNRNCCTDIIADFVLLNNYVIL